MGPWYFSRVVPALGVIAGCCGFLAPRHAWRWPLLIYASQFAVMVARAEGPSALAPVGFIMMAVIALVSAGPAYLGAPARQSRGRASVARCDGCGGRAGALDGAQDGRDRELARRGLPHGAEHGAPLRRPRQARAGRRLTTHGVLGVHGVGRPHGV